MEKIKLKWMQMGLFVEEDWKIFSSKLEHVRLPSKTILLKQGQVENYLSFLAQGTIRFYIPKQENDLTFGFVFEDNFFSAYDSFITRSTCSYQVECLTDTIIWRLNYEDLQRIYETTVSGNLIGRLAAEQLYLIKCKRELSLLDESAERRYLNLFNERPELLKNISLKYIASYIGITPQALSRIRKRIS